VALDQWRPRFGLERELVDQIEVAESYLDVWGNEKHIDPATQDALARALGPQRRPARVRLEPGRCHEPELFERGGRVWGFVVQLYGVRSRRNWGVGDFGDLRRLCDAAAHQGASFIGLSPLHALFPHNPASASPYSPSSRKALNPIYLDVQTLVDLSGCHEAVQKVQSEAFQERLRSLREAELVDYPGVAAAKDGILRILWRHFERNELDKDRSRGAHFLAYMREREHTIGRHALFEALQAHLFAQDPNFWGWPAWPEAY